MKVFITGGSGFIGRALLRQLENKKYEVLMLARNPKSISGTFKTLKGDLAKASKIKDALIKFKPDNIYFVY